jgi:Cu2+-exporting ATPase
MGTGTDVAIESAKITLVKGDLQGIVKKTKSCSYEKHQSKLVLPFYNYRNPIAAGVLYPFGLLLSPMIAALDEF